MSGKKTTHHYDGSGKVTRTTKETNGDGSGKTTVSRGTEGFFGGFSGNIVSETRIDKHGNSYTKKR
jgi:hypothetical protein